MKVLEERDLFLQQVDAGTLEKVEHTQDYVIRTGSGDILMSFRWLDHSPVFLHMTQQQTSLWTENPKILSFAKEISGSGKEELFEFLIALSADDVSQLDELEDRIGSFEEKLFEGDLSSLKRFKDDVKEVNAGYECGLVFEKFNDLAEGDLVEAYAMVEVPRT